MSEEMEGPKNVVELVQRAQKEQGHSVVELLERLLEEADEGNVQEIACVFVNGGGKVIMVCAQPEGEDLWAASGLLHHGAAIAGHSQAQGFGG